MTSSPLDFFYLEKEPTSSNIAELSICIESLNSANWDGTVHQLLVQITRLLGVRAEALFTLKDPKLTSPRILKQLLKENGGSIDAVADEVLTGLTVREALHGKYTPIVVLGMPLLPTIQSIKRQREESEQSEEWRPLKRITQFAPSSLSKPSEYKKVVGSSGTIACNRPLTYDKIPIDLLDKTFGVFKDRCAVLPSAKAVDFAARLADLATQWFLTEAPRRKDITELFGEFDIRLSTDTINGAITDGNRPPNVMPAAIRECKNEEGLAKAQVTLYYGQYLLPAVKSHCKRDTRFPSILITDIGMSAFFVHPAIVFILYLGPTFGFYGAIWNGQVVQVEPLTPIFDLTADPLDERARHAFASSLDALIEGVASIEKHYRKIKSSTETNSSLDYRARRSYPYMDSFEIDGAEAVVAFTSRLYEDKLIFTAQRCGIDYIVKFTRHYSEEAHQYLASLSFAPKLFQCKALPGGWIAVLMERSDYTRVDELTNDQRQLVKGKVSEIVEILHGQDLVHGDIRAANLLVDEKSLRPGGDVKVHFLDFDWAGRVGDAKYPFRVNTSTMTRPSEVKGGGIITKAHDVEMVSYL
ncbi:hypothetical protein PQX77_012335 [Marasmius sp. AFHP31]|nr:hypothetical protein PQX77_012335 [Marasmius sp. AFHP31]